jgi:hypothetical protein
VWERPPYSPQKFLSDITTFNEGAKTDIDVMVTHTMPNGRAVKHEGTAAKYAEQQQLHKHRRTAITPFVFVAHGRLGD